MTTLYLTLKKQAFDVMKTGEKKEEYRKESKWIMSRLNKDYKYVKFTNGYRKESPSFIVEYKGWERVKDVERIYF